MKIKSIISACLLCTLSVYSCKGRSSDINNNDNTGNNNNGTNVGSTQSGWVLVGNANISNSQTASPILRFYEHVPYVAFLDEPAGTSTPKVMKYNSATDEWTTVGLDGDFAAGSAAIAFEIDQSTGDLYLAYSDGDIASLGKLTVKRFDGALWTDLGGAPGISVGAASYVSLTIKNSNPYVAYRDDSDTFVKVQNFNGVSWESQADASAVSSLETSISTDGTDIYVAYIDSSTNQPSIKKYTAGTGVPSTLDAATTAQVSNICISIKNASLHLTYLDMDQSYKGIAKVFDGIIWKNLGCNSTTGIFSDDAVSLPSLYVHSNGISHDVIYVAYSDGTKSLKGTVKSCLNDPDSVTTWSNIGELGFTSTAITGISIYLDTPNPYVAYTNAAGGIEVRKY